jgi:hypothetical protein
MPDHSPDPPPVTLLPRTRREHIAVARLGADGWAVLRETDATFCLNGKPGVLVQKADHLRWMPRDQVRPTRP